MRLRYWTALAATVCIVTAIGFQSTETSDRRAGGSLADRNQEIAVQSVTEGDARHASTAVDGPNNADQYTWSRAIEVGENLDILLTEAGLDALERLEISRAIGSEYDLRRLKPGYQLSLDLTTEGLPRSAMLEVENGQRVHALFGETPSVRTIMPELDTIVRAAEAEIGSSIYAALDQAGIPTRFATDLELILAGTLDLRRQVDGGEYLRVVWRESRLGDRVIGEPQIDYAELDLGAETYEVIWPGRDTNRSFIYKDGRLVRLFQQPILGARLSSAFGLREHPVHGGVRMHSGVDFEVDEGAPVHAIQSGRISFSGERSGYGLMVEVQHTEDLHTIYAHLSTIDEAIHVGQRISSGDEIGRVGSTGTSTAPHLHYEIIVDGQPVPPLTDDLLMGADAEGLDEDSAQGRLMESRNALDQLLRAESDETILQ